jgi:hypothetical protein
MEGLFSCASIITKTKGARNKESLSSKQVCSTSSPAGSQNREDDHEAEPNHNKLKTFKIFGTRTLILLDFHAPSTAYMEETGPLAPQDKLRSQQGIRVSSPHFFLCCV